LRGILRLLHVDPDILGSVQWWGQAHEGYGA
jgi:hypothetical protein